MNLVDAFSGIKSLLTKPAIRPVFPNPVTYNKIAAFVPTGFDNGMAREPVNTIFNLREKGGAKAREVYTTSCYVISYFA